MPLVRPAVRPRNGLDPMTRRRMLALSGAGLSAAALWPRVARAQEAGAPDLIVVEGNLVTQDPTRPQASALALRGGLIQAVGDDEDMRALAGPDTEVIAAAGRTVIPGSTTATCTQRAADGSTRLSCAGTASAASRAAYR